MGISTATIERLKAAPISKVVEALGRPLKRVGREFVTQCVWHEDTNPSLTINDQKGFCFCHVCRGGGDAIKYVQEAKKLSFPDAVEVTAGILNVPVERDDENPEAAARRREERKQALSKLEKEQETYRFHLKHPKAGRIRDILKERNVAPATCREFGLGYAPQGEFGGRITIPIYNHRGELVGFTGRTTKDQPGKYKNSADNPLFNKKMLVFNEQRAVEAAREAGCLVLVEGHLDVVAMWQAGIKNVVAMQGTGAPDTVVVQRLARSVKNFILCFDGDAGGKKAVEQFLSVGGSMALKGEISVNVASLPLGQDPDDVIQSGQDLYNIIASAPSWLDWTIDNWAAALDKEDTAMVTEVEKRLRHLIDGLQSKALRAHYIDKAARALTTSDKEAEKLAKEWGNKTFVSETSDWRPRTPLETRVAAEKRMMRIWVHKPVHREFLAPLLERVQHPPLLWLVKRLNELQEHCISDLTPHSVMAIVAAAEPHFLHQLRTIVRPNVIIDDREGVLNHLHGTLTKDLIQDTEAL